jgi:hypothetical protein
MSIFRVYILIIFFAIGAIAQNIEWANKLLYKTVDYQSVWNYPEAILGPPSIYPDHDYEAELFDLYADGYILYPDKNKHEYIELGFIKAMPANQIVIGGILNDGVVKKIFIIQKDKKPNRYILFPKLPANLKAMKCSLNFH